jgi:hypothetical protein
VLLAEVQGALAARVPVKAAAEALPVLAAHGAAQEAVAAGGKER